MVPHSTQIIEHDGTEIFGADKNWFLTSDYIPNLEISSNSVLPVPWITEPAPDL